MAPPPAPTRVWARDAYGRALDPVELVGEPWPLIAGVPGCGYVALYRNARAWEARLIPFGGVAQGGRVDGTPRMVVVRDGDVEVGVAPGRVVLVVEGVAGG